MKRIHSGKALFKKTGSILKAKVIPIGMVTLLTGLLFTYHNCGSKNDTTSTSVNAAEVSPKDNTTDSTKVFGDGYYVTSKQSSVVLHLSIKEKGTAYSMGVMANDKYTVEYGTISYAGDIATFRPVAHLPSNCEDIDMEAEEWTFFQNQDFLAMNKVGENPEESGLLMLRNTADLNTYFGESASPDCNLLAGIQEGDVDISNGGNEADSSYEVDSSGLGFENIESTSINTIVAAFNQKVDGLKACSYGNDRLSTVHFPLSLYSTNALVANQSPAVSTFSGIIDKVYLGVSNFGDTVVVSKVGSKYYASVSMCPYGGSLISTREIKAFHTPQGITLAESDSAISSILALKNSSLLIGNDGLQAESWFGPTTFYPVNIK